MLKPFVVIPILAVVLTCMPGKNIFGQQVLLITETGQGYVVDLSSSPCKVEPHLPYYYDSNKPRTIAMFSNNLFFMGASLNKRSESPTGGIAGQGLGPGDNTDVLTIDKDGKLYWIDAFNHLITASSNYAFNPNQPRVILGTLPFKATGDMVFYKDKLYLTTEGGVAQVDIGNPANSKMVIATPGREFPGLISVPAGCYANKVFGVEAVGNTTNLVEFDLDQNLVLGIYCSFDLGSKVIDAASPGETGATSYITIGELFTKPSCLPDTNKNQCRVSAFTQAGDSGISYTFTNGSIVHGPITPKRGRLFYDEQLSAGTWTLHLQSSTGCSLDTVFTIAQPALVDAVIEVKPDTCYTQTGQALITTTGGNIPFEFDVEGLPPNLAPFFPSLAVGEYKMKIKDGNSCTSDFTFKIEAYTPPMPITNIAITAAKNCGLGGEVNLTYNSSATVSAVKIDDHDFQTSQQFKNVTAGQHRLYIKLGSCILDTLITVPSAPGIVPEIKFNNKNADCNGVGSTTIQVTNISSPFTVSINAGSFVATTQFTSLVPGIYAVVVKDSYGCEWKAADTILPYISASPPLIDTITNNNECQGRGNIKLVISGTEGPYRFGVEGILYNSGLASASVPTGTYKAIVYNAAKCAVQTVSFTVPEKKDCDTLQAIYVPSAFTPNGDGKNDVLKPMKNPLGKVAHFVFRIYNRSGQILFETRVPNQGWDGKYKSIPQDTGTYVWQFEAIAADGKQLFYQGTTVLIR